MALERNPDRPRFDARQKVLGHALYAADRAVRAAEAAERAASASGAKITPTSFADDEPVIEEDGYDDTAFDSSEADLADTGPAPVAAPPPAGCWSCRRA